ncbi:unnamed protein product [Spirodela intermedia]|uniref:YTH domain-containing family protein n=1 Tax=Spirodela intermedia TaxID=51605 RepID=A0A7I8I8D2_SPIIN|nr:unnamed protein product [Spirodela intermedia]CAA6653895.1 unnamed protein product [Spirodela intermedia]
MKESLFRLFFPVVLCPLLKLRSTPSPLFLGSSSISKMYNGSEQMTTGTYMVPVASSNQQMGLTATFLETGPAGSDGAPKFIVDQGFHAADPNCYGYYCTGRRMTVNGFFGLDGQDLHGSLWIHTFSLQPYNPFIPGAFGAAGGPVLGAQQYLQSSAYQQPVSSPAYFPVLVHSGAENAANFASESFVFSPVSSGPVEPDTLGGKFTQTTSLVTPTKQQSDSTAFGSVPLSPPVPVQVHPSEVSQFVAAHVKQPVVNGAGASVGIPCLRTAQTWNAPFVPSSPKLSMSTYNCSTKFEPNIRGQSTVNRLKPRSQFSGPVNTIKGSVDMLGEQNCGPRTDRSRAPWTLPQVEGYTTKANIQGNITTNLDQFNKEDFPVNYSAAKFFVIKSYSEDDVHKSIKYGVWSSTPNGNKRLDSAYEDAQRHSKGDGEKCPVFLFFSVNASGQFCGVAEMTGHVDFSRDMDFWQQDKWTGSFPVKWHIVKDVPNSNFRHIILENNENKPVTNSRDTQEVRYVPGMNMLSLFKNNPSKMSILDDFLYYEERQRIMHEEKARISLTKQISHHHQAPLEEREADRINFG